MVWYYRHQPTVLKGQLLFYHNNRDKETREDSVKNVIKKCTKPKYQMIIRVLKTNNEVSKYLKCKKKFTKRTLPVTTLRENNELTETTNYKKGICKIILNIFVGFYRNVYEIA